MADSRWRLKAKNHEKSSFFLHWHWILIDHMFINLFRRISISKYWKKNNMTDSRWRLKSDTSKKSYFFSFSNYYRLISYAKQFSKIFEYFHITIWLRIQVYYNRFSSVVVRINRVVMLDKFIKYLESNCDTKKKNRMLTLASQKEEARKKQQKEKRKKKKTIED